MWEQSQVEVADESLRPIVASLEANPLLVRVGAQLLRYDGTFESIRGIALWLLAQSLEAAGPEAAVRDFLAFISTNAAEILFVLALNGISVTEEITLAENVRLVPVDNLPPSMMKDGVLARDFRMALGPPSSYATAALVTNGRVEHFYRATGQETLWNFNEFNLLHIVQLCLTLVGPRASIALSSWQQPLGSGVPISLSAGISSYEPARIDPRYILRAGPFDVERAKIVVATFFQMYVSNRGDAMSLVIPLARLNTAIREAYAVDRSIDLGISLEALLLNDQDDRELSYRLRYRAAWLMGDSVDDRVAIFRLLGQIYSLRSAAVHGGQLDSQSIEKRKATDDLLWEGIVFCARVIEKIMRNGKIPNWQRITLGDLLI